MKTTQLVMVTGMSGAGKSTMSQQLSHQCAMNGIKHTWLHEEMKNHPIRSGEFTAGPRNSLEGLRENIADVYKRWERLVERILHGHHIYIMEGCFFQNITRYFFDCDYASQDIMEFYTTLMKLLEPVSPMFVFLYSSDPKATLHRVFPLRGAWWKELILDPERSPYLEAHGLSGDEGIYRMVQDFQTLSDRIFTTYRGQKIKFDTVQGRWNEYLKTVTELLGWQYYDNADRRTNTATQTQYCGRYRHAENPSEYIDIHADEDGLYCKAFWDYMKLIPLDDHHYYISSFPIHLKFAQQENRHTVQLTGDYDRNFMGKTVIKTEHPNDAEFTACTS